MSIHAEQVNPYIRVARESVLAPGTEIKRRIIFDYELIYVERGEFWLDYGEGKYLCREGQYIFIRPGISHSFRGIFEEVSQPHIHFDLVYRGTAGLCRCPSRI